MLVSMAIVAATNAPLVVVLPAGSWLAGFALIALWLGVWYVLAGPLFLYAGLCETVPTTEQLMIRRPFRTVAVKWSDVQAIKITEKWPAGCVVSIYDARGRWRNLPDVIGAFGRVRWDFTNQVCQLWMTRRGPHWVPLPHTAAAIAWHDKRTEPPYAVATLAAGAVGVAFVLGHLVVLGLPLLVRSDAAFAMAETAVAVVRIGVLPVIAAVFFVTWLVVAKVRGRRGPAGLPSGG